MNNFCSNPPRVRPAPVAVPQSQHLRASLRCAGERALECLALLQRNTLPYNNKKLTALSAEWRVATHAAAEPTARWRTGPYATSTTTATAHDQWLLVQVVREIRPGGVLDYVLPLNL